jgi:phosphotransacetylase
LIADAEVAPPPTMPSASTAARAVEMIERFTEEPFVHVAAASALTTCHHRWS